MSRVALQRESGMTLMEVMVTVLVICTGSLATIGTYVHFSKTTRKARERAVVASLAQREIEQLRPVAYDNLALTSGPTTQAGAEAPLTGPAAGEPVVTGGIVRPGGDAFAVRGVKGRVYRYVTWRTQLCGPLNAKVHTELAGLFGQATADVTAALPELCPATSRTKRVTVAVVPFEEDGSAGAPMRLSTIVGDPSFVALDVLDDTALAVKNATQQAAGPVVEDDESVVTQTTHLTDTRCDQTARQTPADHSTRDTSQQALTCTASGPAPTLLSPSAIGGLPTDPVRDFSTDVTRVATGGRVLLRDTSAGNCTDPTSMVYTNGETAARMGAFHTWATLAPAEDVETPASGGRASLTLWTSTTNGAPAPARLCVTLRRASNGAVIGSSDFKLQSWPGTATQLVTAFNLDHVVVPAGERLLLTLRVPSDSGSDLRVLYDHVSYPSSLAITTAVDTGL